MNLTRAGILNAANLSDKNFPKSSLLRLDPSLKTTAEHKISPYRYLWSLPMIFEQPWELSR